jgi:hypothetical protein
MNKTPKTPENPNATLDVKLPDPRAVVVTTEHRGVFFGYVADESKLPAQITLTQARCAVRWLNGRGFLGLSSVGPQQGSRVSPPTQSLVVYKVTSVADCSAEAVKQWELGLWS